MNAFVDNFFNPEILREVWPLLLAGVWVTVKLCLLVIPLGLAGGLLLALASGSRRRWVRWLGVVYTDFFRVSVSPAPMPAQMPVPLLAGIGTSTRCCACACCCAALPA